MISVTCLNCKTKFEAQRSSAKFCSPKCRVEFNRKTEESAGSVKSDFKASNLGDKKDEPEVPKTEKKPELQTKNKKSTYIPDIPEQMIENPEIINPDAPKTRQMIKPKDGTPAHYLRYGVLWKRDLKKDRIS